MSGFAAYPRIVASLKPAEHDPLPCSSIRASENSDPLPHSRRRCNEHVPPRWRAANLTKMAQGSLV